MVEQSNVPMADAGQDMPGAVRKVDEDGLAAVQARKAVIEAAADRILDENMEAFLELAK